MRARGTPGDTQEEWFSFAKDSASCRYIVRSSGLCSEGNCCLGTVSPLLQRLGNTDRGRE